MLVLAEGHIKGTCFPFPKCFLFTPPPFLLLSLPPPIPETGFLCTTALTILELFVDQVGLDLTELHLPLPPECWG